MPGPAINQHLLTVALADEGSTAFTEYVDVLRLAFRSCRDRYPFDFTAGVILPDHLHCILALPAGDVARDARWRLLRALLERIVGGAEGWRSFEDRPLRGDAELQKEIDCIHADPVRHGLVRAPGGWPFSSLHAYVQQGLRPLHWSCEIDPGCGARATAFSSRTTAV